MGFLSGDDFLSTLQSLEAKTAQAGVPVPHDFGRAEQVHGSRSAAAEPISQPGLLVQIKEAFPGLP